MTSTPKIARVAVAVPGADPFDYLLGTEAAGRADLNGRRVLVPWGRKQAVGIVVGLAEGSDQAPEKLRPMLAVLDDLPPESPAWLAFAAFAARLVAARANLTARRAAALNVAATASATSMCPVSSR